MTTLCIVIVLLHASPLPLSEPISLIKGVPSNTKGSEQENQRGILHSCFFSQLLAPLNTDLTSALLCHFLPFIFHNRLRLYAGPEVQCLGMLLRALV